MPLTVEYEGYVGLQETTRKLPALNATEYALLINESFVANGSPIVYPNVAALGQGTDWQDQVFEKAGISNKDFSLTGGSDKITFSLSASNLFSSST